MYPSDQRMATISPNILTGPCRQARPIMLFATSLKRDSLGHSAIMNFDNNAIQQAVAFVGEMPKEDRFQPI